MLTRCRKRSFWICCHRHNISTEISLNNNGQNTSSRKESSKGPCQEGSRHWRKETHQESRVILHLHLQSAQASAPQHWHLEERHVYSQLVHQRHLRQTRHRGIKIVKIQQEGHPLIQRNPDCRTPSVTWRARQTRRIRGHKGRDQVHLLFSLSRLSWEHTTSEQKKPGVLQHHQSMDSP